MRKTATMARLELARLEVARALTDLRTAESFGGDLSGERRSLVAALREEEAAETAVRRAEGL